MLNNISIILISVLAFQMPIITVSADPLISDSQRAKHLNLDNDKVALSGYDPVSYFKGKPREGNKGLKNVYHGVIYYFSNLANKKAFDANPDKYEPAYGGWCAWAMADGGSKVKIDPKKYKIINDKNYVFYSGWLGDTLKSWNKEAGKGKEKELMNKADNYWKGIVTK